MTENDGAAGVATGTSLDTLADHRAGRASALTTLTPLPRRWSPLLRLVLRLKSAAGPDKTLRRLSFIHAADWVVIDRFPGERRRRRYTYLLFMSNFNGSWFDYIDAFSTAIPAKMALLWGSSFGFPGARPPKPYTRYIRGVDQSLAHYFGAYPSATTTEIGSALRVDDRFGEIVAPAVGEPDHHLVQAWRSFVAQVQRDL